jgi:cell division septation protein DedD
MSHPMISSSGNKHLRRGVFAMLTVASVVLLGGCAIWPKALTFGSDPIEQQAPPPPAIAPVEPAAAQAAPVPAVEARSTVTVTPVAEPAAAEPASAPKAIPPTAMAVAPAPSPIPAAHKVPAAGMAHGYYVNAGLFAVPANGSKAYDKLDHAGLPVFTEILETKKGQRTRVRVGPYPTKAKADAAAKKVRALKLDANVFKY